MKIIQFLFARIFRFFNAKKKAYFRYLCYEKIRKDNPTCSIGDCVLKDVELGRYSVVHKGAVLKSVNLGSFSYVCSGSVLHNAEIGKFCSIGPNVQIGLSPHPTRRYVSTYPGFFSQKNSGCLINFIEESSFDESAPLTILENDVWIGSNAIIPGGIRIGTGAIVGAGSVVVKDVPPYAVVGGNPARLIRYRFSEEVIDSLKNSAWWDWPEEVLKARALDFANVAEFLKNT